MTVSDYLVAVVRTTVPAVAGYLISMLAGVGVELDSGALTAVVSGLFIGGYYAVAHALEAAHPWFGVLLGWVAQPTYSKE